MDVYDSWNSNHYNAYNILEEKIAYEPYYIYIILQTFNYIFRKLTKYEIPRSKDILLSFDKINSNLKINSYL